jgi:hypothetical protein
MAYTDYKNLGMVVKEYHLKVTNEYFLADIPFVPATEWLKEEIKFAFEQGLYRVSEIAIGEQLIYPVLKEVWKSHFLKDYLLWSHTAFVVNATLSGTPDYILAKRTDYDNAVVGIPVLVMIEAKKDNFEEGWGQCAAEMVASQKANESTNTKVHGIVSNGEKWEFAYLQDSVFTKNIAFIDILDTDRLYSAIHAILAQQ